MYENDALKDNDGKHRLILVNYKYLIRNHKPKELLITIITYEKFITMINMWKKIFRKSHVLNYRKKFKCPACNKYALYVIHDKACKCAQGCNTRDFDIDQIMGKNDFDGYFTSKELEESFYTNDDLCNSLLKKLPLTIHSICFQKMNGKK